MSESTFDSTPASQPDAVHSQPESVRTFEALHQAGTAVTGGSSAATITTAGSGGITSNPSISAPSTGTTLPTSSSASASESSSPVTSSSGRAAPNATHIVTATPALSASSSSSSSASLQPPLIHSGTASAPTPASVSSPPVTHTARNSHFIGYGSADVQAMGLSVEEEHGVSRRASSEVDSQPANRHQLGNGKAGFARAVLRPYVSHDEHDDDRSAQSVTNSSHATQTQTETEDEDGSGSPRRDGQNQRARARERDRDGDREEQNADRTHSPHVQKNINESRSGFDGVHSLDEKSKSRSADTDGPGRAAGGAATRAAAGSSAAASAVGGERQAGGSLPGFGNSLSKEAEKERRKERKRRKKERKRTKHRKINKQHPEFELSYDMMLGIRTTVGRSEGRNRGKELKKDDMFETRTLRFPGLGSAITPAHQMRDFKFKDYAPEVFRCVRERFGLHPADYLTTVCGNFHFLEFISNSKSGQFFFYSFDRKYMIKTVSKDECKFLRKFLPAYYQHVLHNPDSLLTRFYGMHRVKPHKKKVVHFLVMGSVFYTDKYIHHTFDLKGSKQGRNATEKERQRANVVFKDNDFLELGTKIRIGPEKGKLLLEQLQRDVDFLAKLRIMDYSLLLGIHYKNRGKPHTIEITALDTEANKDAMDDATFDGDARETNADLDDWDLSKTLSPKQTLPGKGSEPDGNLSARKTARDANESKREAADAEHDLQPPHLRATFSISEAPVFFHQPAPHSPDLPPAESQNVSVDIAGESVLSPSSRYQRHHGHQRTVSAMLTPTHTHDQQRDRGESHSIHFTHLDAEANNHSSNPSATLAVNERRSTYARNANEEKSGHDGQVQPHLLHPNSPPACGLNESDASESAVAAELPLSPNPAASTAVGYSSSSASSSDSSGSLYAVPFGLASSASSASSPASVTSAAPALASEPVQLLADQQEDPVALSSVHVRLDPVWHGPGVGNGAGLASGEGVGDAQQTLQLQNRPTGSPVTPNDRTAQREGDEPVLDRPPASGHRFQLVDGGVSTPALMKATTFTSHGSHPHPGSLNHQKLNLKPAVSGVGSPLAYTPNRISTPPGSARTLDRQKTVAFSGTTRSPPNANAANLGLTDAQSQVLRKQLAQRQSHFGLPKNWSILSKPSDIQFSAPEFEPLTPDHAQFFAAANSMDPAAVLEKLTRSPFSKDAKAAGSPATTATAINNATTITSQASQTFLYEESKVGQLEETQQHQHQQQSDAAARLASDALPLQLQLQLHVHVPDGNTRTSVAVTQSAPPQYGIAADHTPEEKFRALSTPKAAEELKEASATFTAGPAAAGSVPSAAGLPSHLQLDAGGSVRGSLSFQRISLGPTVPSLAERRLHLHHSDADAITVPAAPAISDAAASMPGAAHVAGQAQGQASVDKSAGLANPPNANGAVSKNGALVPPVISPDANSLHHSASAAAASSSPHHVSSLFSDPQVCSLHSVDADHEECYFMGVIDILTLYSVKKRLEHFAKGFKYNRHEISAVPPKEYAKRFIDFIRNAIV